MGNKFLEVILNRIGETSLDAQSGTRNLGHTLDALFGIYSRMAPRVPLWDRLSGGRSENDIRNTSVKYFGQKLGVSFGKDIRIIFIQAFSLFKFNFFFLLSGDRL